MRYMPDGTAVTSFSIAVNDGWGDNRRTLWFRVSIWGKRAETANQYLSKGSKVLVEGRMQGDPQTGGPKLWTRQDGTVGSSFEVTASNFTFLSSRGEDSGYDQGDGDADFGSSAIEEDDIPF